jgi:hypothetical protein
MEAPRPGPPRWSSRPASAGLDRPLELARPGAHEHSPQQVRQRAADHQAEHPAEVNLQRVGRPRPVPAQVLQLPAALNRLQLALLLPPGQGDGTVAGSFLLKSRAIQVRRDSAMARVLRRMLRSKDSYH